jgi:hypothetical protein
MKWSVFIMIGVLPSLCVAAERRGARDAFAVVFIDERTEARLGPIPYDRSVYAKGIERLGELGALGVVLKFFIDQPKSREGDEALAAAMGKVKVVMQARIDEDEKAPNPLPERFFLSQAERGRREAIGGESGWLPLEKLAEKAHDVGFIDSRDVSYVPMVEQYRGRLVKSVYRCAIELAAGEPVAVEPGKGATLGKRRVALDGLSQLKVEFPKKDEIDVISLVDVLDGKVERPRVEGRVVIFANDGAKMHTVETPMGAVKAHRAFCHQLFSAWRQLAE